MISASTMGTPSLASQASIACDKTKESSRVVQDGQGKVGQGEGQRLDGSRSACGQAHGGPCAGFF